MTAERAARWQLPLTIALGAVAVTALIALAVAWHNAAGIFFAALVILHLLIRLVLRRVRRRRRVQPVDREDELRDVPKTEPSQPHADP